MIKLQWDEVGKHFYTNGVDHAVLYDYDAANGTYHPGTAWSGITAINESPSGAEPNPQYADNIKYLNIVSAEEYALTIEAFYSPEEFDKCDGTTVVNGVRYRQQSRKMFGLSYRTKIGSDANDDLGYVLHLVYGCKASPSEQNHETINESPEGATLSWEVNTTPISVNGDPSFKPLSVIEIDSTTVDADKLASFEEILYGKQGTISYSAASPVGTENPSTEGWYERSGSDPDYVYTLTSDTTVDSEKTYYIKSETGGVEAMLPLPHQVKSHFAAG